MVNKNPILLSANQTFSDVYDLSSQNQGNYPVVDHMNNILGVLTSPAIAYAKKNKLRNEGILNFISNVHGQVKAESTLKSVFADMDQHGWYTVDVIFGRQNCRNS